MKVLDMVDLLIPKRCYLKLHSLLDTPYKMSNWLNQLRKILALVAEEKLIHCLLPDIWRANKDIILTKFQEYKQSSDVARYTTSTACQFYFKQPILDVYPAIF